MPKLTTQCLKLSVKDYKTQQHNQNIDNNSKEISIEQDIRWGSNKNTKM